MALPSAFTSQVGASNSATPQSTGLGALTSQVGAKAPSPPAANPYAAPPTPSVTRAVTPPVASGGTSSYYGPGTTALATSEGFDPKGGNELSTMYKTLGFNLYPGAASNAAFGSAQDYGRQQAIQNYLNLENPASLQTELMKVQNQNNEQAALGQRNASLETQAAGLGSGYQAGAAEGIGQQAQIANEQAARAYAPSGPVAQQMYQNQMNAYAQAYQNPELQTLMQLWNPIEQQENTNYQQRGQGVLGAIAPIIGGAVGQYLGAPRAASSQGQPQAQGFNAANYPSGYTGTQYP